MTAQNKDILKDGLSADEYAKEEFELVKAYDWEKLNGFQFFTYPYHE
jgi:hypothetical protein